MTWEKSSDREGTDDVGGEFVGEEFTHDGEKSWCIFLRKMSFLFFYLIAGGKG